MMEANEIPKDRYYFVKIGIFLLGMAIVLPFNLLINPTEYWMLKLENPEHQNESISSHYNESVGNVTNTPKEPTKLQKEFMSYVTIATGIPILIMLFIKSALGRRISLTTSITWPLVGIILVFIGTTSVVYVNSNNSQLGFVVGTLISIVIINCFNGLVMGSSTGIVGFLPVEYLNFFSYAQTMAAIVVSILNILTLAIGPSPQLSAVLFFGIAVLMLVIILVYFLYMSKTAFFVYYFNTQVPESKQLEDMNYLINETTDSTPVTTVFKQIWIYSLAIFFLGFVTLLVFPALFVLVQSTSQSSSIIYKRYFTPIFVFLLYNIIEFFGRAVAAKFSLPGTKGFVELILTTARLALIPLTVLCNIQPRHNGLPVVFENDVIFMVIVAVTGFSSGHLYTIIMTKAPRIVLKHNKEKAASLLVFFYGFGVTTGSLTCLGIINVL